MATIIHEERETEIPGARVVGDALWLAKADVHRATGWTLKPEGLCRDETCVPVPRGREAEFVAGDSINVGAFWRHMGSPVVKNAAGDTWVLGTSARDRARALESLQALDFTLPDLAGRMHSLAEQRGKKVLLVTWASW